MQKIIIANWKLNPISQEEAEKLAKASDIEGLVICPPFPFLKVVAKVIKKAKLGAQDLFWEEKGAYTGEVSPAQLKDFCVEYVIIGHSERRQNLGETDEMVARKVAAALQDGLKPILCVGETRAERDAGKTEEVVGRELKIGTSLIGNWKLEIGNLIVAYEPIWAIGTGTPDAPEDVLEMVEFIKNQLISYADATVNEFPGESNSSTHQLINSSKIIYGGSVTSKNAEKFLKHKEIGGALVGGASLNPVEIKKIIKVAEKCK